MNLVQANRPALLERAAALASEDAGFAEFLRSAVLATDTEDLARQAPDRFEAILRQSYAHLKAYSGTGSKLSVTAPTQPSAVFSRPSVIRSGIPKNHIRNLPRSTSPV